MYLFKITFTYTDKNKLFADLFRFVQEYNGTLILDKESLKKFKQQLQDKLETLHKIHSRCKPIQVYYRNETSGRDKGDIHVWVPGSWTANIYKVNKKL